MKKGFTLVELLAVIAVLAIISLITVPLITGVVESSRKNAKQSSAKGYINSVNDQIVSNEFDDETEIIKDGKYYTSLLKEVYKLSVGGEEPIEDSWVEIENSTVTNYSLKFDKYVVSMNDSEETVTKNADVLEHDMCMKMHSKRKRVNTLGDSYGCEIGDGIIKQFYYLSDDNSTITLIAAENLENDKVSSSNKNSKLDILTEDWDIDAYIPTLEQISKNGLVYAFITKNLDEQDIFWTTTDIISNTGNNGHISSEGLTAGIRPVIVVNKEGKIIKDQQK